MMSSSKELFSQYLSTFNPDSLTTTVEIAQIGGPFDQRFQKYKCVFQGPFIFCDSVQNLPNEPHVVFPIFFTPQYIYRPIDRDTVIFVPIYPDIAYSYVLKFPSNELMNAWVGRAHSIRFNIEKMSRELPPFVFQVLIEGIDAFTFVIAIISSTQIMYEVSNRTVAEFQIDQITSICVASALGQPRNDSYSAVLSVKLSKKQTITFKSRDDFILGFTVIFYGLNYYGRTRQSNIVDIVFAQEPEEEEEKLVFKDESPLTTLFPIKGNCSKALIKTTESPTFSSVTVPKKASDQLEILSFGLPMKRRVAFAFYSESTPARRQRRVFPKSKEIVSCDTKNAFSRELARIVEDINIKQNEVVITKAQKSRLTFSILEPSLNDFFETENDATSFLIGKEAVLPQDIKQLFDKLKFPVTQMHFVHGNEVTKEINLLTSYLSNPESLTSPSSTKLCLIVASILNDLPLPTINLQEELKAFIQEDKMISACFPVNCSDPLLSCAVFVSRLLLSQRLGLLFKRLARYPEWREKNYMYGSLMLNSPFICDIAESLFRAEKRTFVDSFDCKVPRKLLPLESLECRIISVCKGILEMQRRGTGSSDSYVAIYGLLISLVCEFFSVDFIPPPCCVISCLRSSWYTFASSTDIPVTSHELVALKATVKECSMTPSGDPATLLRMLFFKGFINGLAWSFVLFGGARAQSEHLYATNAPASSPQRISTIAIALASLRTTMIDLDEEAVLDYAAKFSSLPHT